MSQMKQMVRPKPLEFYSLRKGWVKSRDENFSEIFKEVKLSVKF